MFYITFRLLYALQSLADKIPIQQNETITVAKKSIAMKVITVKPNEIKGLSITAISTSQRKVNDLVPNLSNDKSRNVIATVYLPGPLFSKVHKSQNDIQRITVFVFDDEKLFLTNITKDNFFSGKRRFDKAVGGRILSASITGSNLSNLSESEQIRTTFSPSIPSVKREADCVFWDFNSVGMFIFIRLFRDIHTFTEYKTKNEKLFQAPFSIKCGVSHVRVFTPIDKPFFPHFGQFSKRLSSFKHSYLSQMTSKN